MKMRYLLGVMVLAGGLRATAGPAAQQDPSASHSIQTNAVPVKVAPLQPALPANGEIQRVGKMSSRPWSQIVGWRQGISQFPDAENHESQMALLSVSFGPQHRPPQTAISGP